MEIKLMFRDHQQNPGFFDVHRLFFNQSFGQKVHFIPVIKQEFFSFLISFMDEIVYFLIDLAGCFFTIIFFLKKITVKMASAATKTMT